MEYNKIFSEQQDVDAGQKWKMPQCTTCKYNKGRTCTYYNADRLQLPVDMFNCPTYEKKVSEKEQAQKILSF